MGYLSEEAGEAVKRYKYSGGDQSLIYQHILTPMNKWLIEFFPKWVAPNVITCTGLVLSISANILTWLYSPDFADKLPGWVCFYVVFAVFAYQTLDNLDGRQARRTGSSSPLGLLFDHGIDAVNITVASMAVFAVVQPKASIDLLLIWFEGLAPFFFATWEEYYVGTLILPVLNGPTEGIFIAMGFCSLQGAGLVDFGATVISNFPSIAQYSALEFMYQWPTVRIIVAAGVLTVPPTCMYHAYGAFKFQWRKKGLLGVFGAIYRLSPYLVFSTIISLWYTYSPAQTFQQHPRLFMLAHCFIFCVLACEVMLAHIAEQKYKPSSTLRVLVPQMLAFSTVHPAFHFVDEYTALVLLFVWSFAMWFHMVHGVIDEMTTILNIRCFSIRPVKEKVKGDDGPVYADAAATTTKRSTSSPSAPVLNGHSNSNGFHSNGLSTTKPRSRSQQRGS